MSWSFEAIGTADALNAAMEKAIGEYGEGQSKEEFKAAAPHLQALISMNKPSSGYPELVKIKANGSATWRKGKDGAIEVLSSTCFVSIDHIGPVVS